MRSKEARLGAFWQNKRNEAVIFSNKTCNLIYNEICKKFYVSLTPSCLQFISKQHTTCNMADSYAIDVWDKWAGGMNINLNNRNEFTNL